MSFYRRLCYSCCQNAYQRQTASNNHKNDEGLKVIVFDKNVCVASQFPEDTSDGCLLEEIQQGRTFSRAAFRTAVVWILNEDDINLK